MNGYSGLDPLGMDVAGRHGDASPGEGASSPVPLRPVEARHSGLDPLGCDPAGHCSVCSDEAVPMRVLEVLDGGGIAVCAGEEGRRVEVLIGALDDVVCGDVVLVHAGAALARVPGGGVVGEVDGSEVGGDGRGGEEVGG